MAHCNMYTISEQDEETYCAESVLEMLFLYKNNEMSGSRGIPINHYYSLLFLSLLHEMHAAMDLRPFLLLNLQLTKLTQFYSLIK